MAERVTINVPMNRVEGDLEIRVEIVDGTVTDAWSSGVMYRGFEQILVGRGARDGLVITPRICGVCSTSHLLAAARALDAIARVAPPPDAVRIRNVAVATEHIQSDMRHAFLMFTADFVNPAHRNRPLFDEAVRRFEPFRGASVVEVIRATKRVLEVIAILGGQWPHSSFMVPGGIVSVPSRADLTQCRLLLRGYRNWYEQQVLGCPIERWLEVESAAQLDAWLAERDEHREGDLGFVLRFAREIGLDAAGTGHRAFLSFGSLDLPDGTRVKGGNGQARLVPAGFVRDGELLEFDSAKVAEHVASSWFVDYPGGRHPFEGETKPYASGAEGRKYSWAKAPRYDGTPAETGPLAEAMVAGKPLFRGLVGAGAASPMTRQLARLTRPAALIPAMETWLGEIDGDGEFYRSPGEVASGDGCGLTEAARGALGHWVRVADGVIEHYQVITPTTWNASPRDSDGLRGPIEEALMGTAVADLANPVELGHVVRSFDPCLVCTVHAIARGSSTGRLRVGVPA